LKTGYEGREAITIGRISHLLEISRTGKSTVQNLNFFPTVRMGESLAGNEQ
jgi:hypothetical protein